ncbi:MAG TPA: hypothetical protein VFE47_09505 [Tepidisphaeraceae bacterium]|jgi:hypothetical protein|nr:hypothetical protein [Tepidisphaeraceae bacterium]
MEKINDQLFAEWCEKRGITSDAQGPPGEPRFKMDFPFRVPIGDFELQLDFRIKHIFDLLNWKSGVWVLKRTPWDFGSGASMGLQRDMLRAIHQSIGIPNHARVFSCTPDERPLVQALAYLTNRWTSDLPESLYVISRESPDYIVFCCGHPESIFVQARDRALHDAAVARLRDKKVPAFGPLIPSPYLQEPYKGHVWMGKILAVDEKTGKAIGAGSAESTLKPEFREPMQDLEGNKTGQV